MKSAFRKWQFIRLPEKFGGEKIMFLHLEPYSMICLHLWCMEILATRRTYEGRMSMSWKPRMTSYRYCIWDQIQAPPSDTLPELNLRMFDGNLFVTHQHGDQTKME